MQNNRWLQTLIVLLVIISAIYLAGLVWSFVVQFSSVLLLFFVAWLLAFMLRPLARMLSARGLSYGWSVLIVYLGLAVIAAILGFLLVPTITDQVSQLSLNFNSYVSQGQRMAADAENLLKSFGVSSADIQKFYSDLSGQVQTIGVAVLNNTLSVLQSIATLMFQLVLVLILSFYFMKDGERIFGGILQLLPPRWQDEGRLLAMSIEKSFGAFVRGQLLFAIIYSLLTGGVMLAFGLDYVVIASIASGFAMLIPLVGNYIAFAPPVLVCLVTGKADIWPWVLLACFVVQGIQMNVIGPRIMSQAVGIHPLYVMAAMLIGGQVAGLWGAVFGIPVAGTINLVGRPLMRRVRYQSPLYQEPHDSYLTTRSFATGPLRPSMVEQYEKAKVAASTSSLAFEEAPAAIEPAESTVDLEPDGDSATLTAVPKSLVTPTSAHAPSVAAATDYDLDYEEPRPLQPTLSAKAWRVAWLFVSRAYTWVGARAHIRTSRH